MNCKICQKKTKKDRVTCSEECKSELKSINATNRRKISGDFWNTIDYKNYKLHE